MLIFKRPSDMEFRQVKRLASRYDLRQDEFEQSEFTILKNDDKLLAFGRVRHGTNYAELDCLGVIETNRGKGWGKMMVNKLLSDGPSTIWVTTDTPKYFEHLDFIPAKQLPKELARRVEASQESAPKSRLKGLVYSKKKS